MHANPVSRLIKSLALAAAVLFSATSLAAKLAWEPVPPADLALKECAGYPGAAAEALFNRIKLDASSSGTWCDYMVRIKVYNAAGAQSAGLVSVNYPKGRNIWNFAARLTKVDGTSTELDTSAFVDSVELNSRKEKVTSKSIAIPNLESGDIVDYRWSATSSSVDDIHQTFTLQRGIKPASTCQSIVTSPHR